MTGLGRRMLAPVSPRFYDSTTPEACTNFASLLLLAVYTPFYLTSLRDSFTGSSTTWRRGLPGVPVVLLTDWIGQGGNRLRLGLLADHSRTECIKTLSLELVVSSTRLYYNRIEI